MPWAAAAATVAGAVISSQASQGAASTSADAQRYAADQAAAAARFKPVGITTRFGQSGFGYGGQPAYGSNATMAAPTTSAPMDIGTWAAQSGLPGYDVGIGSYNPYTIERYNAALAGGAVPSITQQGQSPYGSDEMSSAGYTLSPELKAIQDRIMSSASSYDPSQYQQASQTMFNLGSKYLATSPEEAAAKYAEQQRSLLAPGRETALAALRNQQYQSGRGGLGISSGTGMSATNPEAAAYYNALAQQEKELAMNADLYGRERTNYGIGLMSSAPDMYSAGYKPLMSSLGLANTIEGMGQQSLALSSELAGRQSTAGANAGQYLLSGGMSAAKSLQSANQYSPYGAALTAFGTSPKASAWFDKLIGGGSTNYDGWQTSGDNTYSNYQSSEGYSGMNQELGITN